MPTYSLTILDLEQTDLWLEALEAGDVDDIYYRPEYLRMVAANGEGSPKLALFKCARGVVLYPFLLRSINLKGSATGYWDISSPYGYSGPVVRPETPEIRNEVSSTFTEAFHGYCLDVGVVSEFIRFHPLLCNSEAFAGLVELTNVNDTVYVKLSDSLETIWNHSLDGKTRNAVRKAQKLGVSVTVPGRIGDFRNLYSETMQRLQADYHYFFSDQYFHHLSGLIPNRANLLEAKMNGATIASIALLQGGQFSHYHLSASDANHRNVPATSFLLWEGIKHSKVGGIRLFHLGGGYAGVNGSLFRFKAGFSSCRARYVVAKVIHHNARYEQLVKEAFEGKALEPPAVGSYFPLYRAVDKRRVSDV